jgi:hypothetical protein
MLRYETIRFGSFLFWPVWWQQVGEQAAEAGSRKKKAGSLVERPASDVHFVGL